MRAWAWALGALLSVGVAHGELRRYALLISHPDGGPGTEALRFVEADARKLADVLTDLGGFKAEDITRLKRPDVEAITTAFARVEARVRAARAEGDQALFLLYYTGHADAGRLRLGRERLAFERLKADLIASHAEVRLAFLDACQSGGITRLKGGRRAPSFIVDVEPQRSTQGLVIITSSAADEASQESDELGGSFFTHYLVSGLRGRADASGDGRVTLDEAYAYAYHRTVSHTTGTRGGTQHPTYTYDLQGNGGVTLSRLAGLSGLIFPAHAEGRYLVYNRDQGMVIGEVEPRAARRRIWVPAGHYIIKQRAEDHLLQQTLHLAAAEQRVVDMKAFERVDFEADLTKGAAPRARLDLSARLGYQRFFDAPTREGLFHPTRLIGLRLEGEGLISSDVSVNIDGAFGQASTVVPLRHYDEAQPVDFSIFLGGVGLRVDHTRGALRLQAGPQLTAIYARRRFPQTALGLQDLLTLSPGLGLGGRLAWGPLRLGVEARASYLRYVSSGASHDLGFGEAYLSLGYAP
ncbi:caspase family protein [Myxococcota bacterium]|nr:caspase family protein [Myxococcota bacterium]MBU1899694.1 caspase family protein [Myxococcota bacterium]